MRKTIRRGIFLTVTAACALGFGVSQASAAPVPSVPALPLSGLGALTNLGTLSNLNDSFSILPAMPTMPTMPNMESRGLPTAGGLAGLGELSKLLAASQLTGELLGLGPVTDLTNLSQSTGGLLPQSGGLLPQSGGLLPTGLPTEKIGTPETNLSTLPVDPTQLLTELQLPTTPDDITESSVVDMLRPDSLPVLAQDDHKKIVEKVAREADGLGVQGLLNPTKHDLATSSESVELPAGAPQPVSVQSGGLPEQLPAVSGLGAADLSGIQGMASGLALPTV